MKNKGKVRHGICVAKMLDKTSSIICAFGLAAAAPRSLYLHLELCGIAIKIKKPPVLFCTGGERKMRDHSMKKLGLLLFSSAMALSLAACGECITGATMDLPETMDVYDFSRYSF